jgi:quercetin 2,3-dioxygenase
MKRRHFISAITASFALLPNLLFSRDIKTFEFKLSKDRKRIDQDWMHMYQSFNYFDYDFIDDMGFGHLRVIDDFEVGHLIGTPVHPHKDMEILSILLEGQIFHQDTLGNSGLLKAGDYQLMSAGSGLKHAETNPSQFDKARGLQIWISSNNKTGKPSYQQINREEVHLHDSFVPIASSHLKNCMHFQANAQLLRGKFDKAGEHTYTLHDKNNGLYCFMIDGEVKVFDRTLHKGDGLGISTKESVAFHVTSNSDLIIIEVPLQGTF